MTCGLAEFQTVKSMEQEAGVDAPATQTEIWSGSTAQLLWSKESLAHFNPFTSLFLRAITVSRLSHHIPALESAVSQIHPSLFLFLRAPLSTRSAFLKAFSLEPLHKYTQLDIFTGFSSIDKTKY